MTEDEDGAEYSERADFLDSDSLYGWTIDHEHFRSIQRKITQSGAKLVIGPRGSGKTHHFRYAHLYCQNSSRRPFTVYVSFTRYYHLEPYLRQSREALHVFHAWVLAKILLGVADSSPERYEDHVNNGNVPSVTDLEGFVSKAERVTDPSDLHHQSANFSIRNTVQCIESITHELGRPRAVVMLDDAALVLTPEYMTEFFDVFRSLKTSKLSPKASVYPGTTEYGPRFHADHDAEKVQAWLDIDSSDYPTFMERIARDRLNLPASTLPGETLKSLAYAAFGIPRAFITMCRHYIDDTSKGAQQRFNKVIRSHVDFRKTEYLSLADKIPQYRDIIYVGWQLFDRVIEDVKVESKKSLPSQKSTQVGILRNLDRKRERMIRFLIEAGLLYERPAVSHGPDRDYARFVPHYAFLIDQRTFISGRGWSPEQMNRSIQAPEKKHPIRRQVDSLLQPEDVARIELNLPACRDCGTERLSAHQSYCHNCGSKLIEPSIFEQCMKIPVEDLPITETKKERIKNQTQIRTLGDIIHSDDPASELRKARSIGQKWAERIYSLAKSVEEEFFS